ncbi:MAG: serine/threonine-protein phosphatase, partial [Lachnospiraceae bacterium]|nr:serine/threonine-protein phosphatase [Lachnospiraceae bacterium]
EFYDKPVRLQKDDVVAVFSNGMSESIAWKEMEDCLSRKKSCNKTAFDLVEMVNQKKGDKDNASVILIRVGELT